MATLNAQVLGSLSLKPTYQAVAAGGDTAPVGPTTFAVFKNVNAATRTITIAVPGNDWNGVAAPDTSDTIAATTGETWFRLDPRYADPATGRAAITYTSDVGVSVAIVTLG